MQIGIIGLGRMGANMARRLMRGGHSVVVYDLNQESVGKMVKEGAGGAANFMELAGLCCCERYGRGSYRCRRGVGGLA